jgi:hypothetical protein
MGYGRVPGSSLCCGPLDEEVMPQGNLVLFAIEDNLHHILRQYLQILGGEK